MNEESKSMSYDGPTRGESSREVSGYTGRLTEAVNTPQVEGDYNDRVDVQASSGSDVRGININPLSSGYMVKVGCQSVAVETTEKLVDMINKYLTDPSGFEKKWYSKDVRNRLENI